MTMFWKQKLSPSSRYEACKVRLESIGLYGQAIRKGVTSLPREDDKKYVCVLINLWLSKGILFLQNNAATHKAAITHHKLADLHFEVLKHPAYSPDLAPSYYYLFPNLFIKPKTYQPPLVEPDLGQ
jgi:hypothetical protein